MIFYEERGESLRNTFVLCFARHLRLHTIFTRLLSSVRKVVMFNADIYAAISQVA